MIERYIYNLYNKKINVIPLTNNECRILSKLNVEVDNYFIDEAGKENYRIYVVSGHDSMLLVDASPEVEILNEINTALHTIYCTNHPNFMNWKEVVEKALLLVDYKTGLYKIKNIENSYVIITDYKETYSQMYKVHAALESLCVYLLSFEKAVIYHSSCAGFDQEHCNLFIGQSGMGKSTIAKMFEDNGGCIVDDEKNIVVEKEGKYFVYSGQTRAIKRKFGYKRIEYGKLENIFFLKHGAENCKKIMDCDAKLMETVLKYNAQIGSYRESHPIVSKKLIRNSIARLFETVPVYELKFNLDIDVKLLFDY